MLLSLILPAAAQTYTPTPVTVPAGFGGIVSAAGDMNADGCDDVVAAAPGSNTIWVLYGGASGLDDSLPHAVFSAESVSWAQFAATLSAAGDVNGDGYADVVAGARYDGYDEAGMVFVVFGSKGAITQLDAYSGSDGSTHYQFGWSSAGIGDLNGDGYDDVIGGAFSGHSWAVTRGTIGFGASSGLSRIAYVPPTVEVDGWDCGGCDFAKDVAATGDVNGDGYDDVMIQGYGGVRLYYGNSSGAPSEYAGYSGFGGALGDINGDGYDDFQAESLYYGGPTGNNGTFTLPDADGSTATLLASIGDINGDGYDDVLARAGKKGTIYRYLGGKAGLTVGDVFAEADSTQAIQRAGDINGDGAPDFLQSSGGSITVLLSDGKGEKICVTPSLAEPDTGTPDTGTPDTGEPAQPQDSGQPDTSGDDSEETSGTKAPSGGCGGGAAAGLLLLVLALPPSRRS